MDSFTGNWDCQRQTRMHNDSPNLARISELVDMELKPSVIDSIEPAGDATGTPRVPRRWTEYQGAVNGLQEYWYPAALAKHVRRKKKVACVIAGNKIFLAYNQGKFYAVHDSCPHRQIPLSIGSLEFPGHVSCIYHGWVFNLE